MQNYYQRLYSKTKEEFQKEVFTNLKNNKRMFIITANPETFTYATKDPLIDKMLVDPKSTLIPDGICIVKTAKMLKYNLKERITGIDLATALLEECNKKHYKLALLGAKEEVLTALISKINSTYPNISIVKYQDGYTNKNDEFFEELVTLKPDVCLVALGIPNQEKLIYKHLNNFNKGVFVGVGGSFDVLSGTKKRAPKLFQKLNLEWLYRLIKEPKRIKRFYNNNIKFMFKVLFMKK